MGIKHLWTILTPFGERKPLYELQGKTVAIDLSCWICEAQNITDYYIQPKMYLRNLYFRTCYLLLMGVNPVFVLEGKAPELKYETIAARNEIQFKGAKPRQEVKKPAKDRSRFNFVLQRCQEMLNLMGLACVKGKGEAEAMCAYLNTDKLVDGCISQDSDCFAYGARIVFRNFSISQQGVHTSSGGAVDVYDIQKVEDGLKFGRNKIIALALLCGSDYSDGVYGIGKEAAMKLFERVSDKDILNHLRSWKTNNKFYDDFYKKLNNKNVCTSCGHFGKLQSHMKSGCKECKMTKGCDFSKFKDKRLEIKNEISMRTKALADPNFPNEELISEFLEQKENVSELNLKWKQPELRGFVNFTVKHLQWEAIYAFEKFLPILTRWQLVNWQMIQSNQVTKGILALDSIKKVRNPKGIPSYEVLWSDHTGYYKDVMPTNELTKAELEKLWSTVEPQELVSRAHVDCVHVFEQGRIKPKKATKRKQRAKVDELGNLLANTSISDSKPKKSNRKLTQSRTIDSYFKQAVLNNAQAQSHSTPVKHSVGFDFPDASRFGDEDDLELSAVVQDIVSCSPLKYIQENLKKLEYCEKNTNESSFFISEIVENDLFERSMLCKDGTSSDKENSSTEEDFKEDNGVCGNLEETFSEEYVPLLARLKQKN